MAGFLVDSNVLLDVLTEDPITALIGAADPGERECQSDAPDPARRMAP